MHSVVDTLIVSDLHLGTPASQAEHLLSLLQSTSFKRLILLGDVFEDGDLKRLNRKHWELLSYIRALTNPNLHKEVIWVRGNHDLAISRAVSPIVGVKLVEQYIWRYNGVQYLAIHGDQFDYYMSQHRVITSTISKGYSYIRSFYFGNATITALFDKIHNSLLRPRSRFARAAARYALEKNASVVFCGHTHDVFSKTVTFGSKNITYHNVGCWTKLPATYAVIGNTGIEIRSYPKESGTTLVARFFQSHFTNSSTPHP